DRCRSPGGRSQGRPRRHGRRDVPDQRRRLRAGPRMRRRLVLLALALLAIGVVFVPLGSARAQDLPGDATIEATGPGGAVYSYDAGDLICSPPSGSVFAIGPTTVSCQDSGGADAGSFTVTVEDTTPPAITVPSNISVDGTGPTVVTYTEPTASDIVDGTVTPS